MGLGTREPLELWEREKSKVRCFSLCCLSWTSAWRQPSTNGFHFSPEASGEGIPHPFFLGSGGSPHTVTNLRVLKHPFGFSTLSPHLAKQPLYQSIPRSFKFNCNLFLTRTLTGIGLGPGPEAAPGNGSSTWDAGIGLLIYFRSTIKASLGMVIT